MERRHFTRVKEEFKILVEIDQSDNNLKFKEGSSINVSGSGILFSYDKPLNLNDFIKVKFLKPNSFEFFEVVGQVVRVELNLDKTYDIGMDFSNINEDQKLSLDYYLQINE